MPLCTGTVREVDCGSWPAVPPFKRELLGLINYEHV
jgi:hypothetical protein